MKIRHCPGDRRATRRFRRRDTGPWQGILGLAVVLSGLPSAAEAACTVSPSRSSLAEIVDRVTRERLRYLFVGELHGVGAVKRFVVDLANSLIDRGFDVGLYVEGFREDCEPRDESCWSLAGTFNRKAFLGLLDDSKAPVHPIDPPGSDFRARRMAETIAAGSEQIRIALLGRSHVLYVGDPDADHRVFGGALSYPDPGDVAEAFPREESLTFGLETGDPEVVGSDSLRSYSLRRDGCATDYVLTTADTADY